MGYATFSNSGKEVIKSEDIGSGQIELRHLSPSLYSELRQVSLHNHTGSKSRKINLKNLTGAFGVNGFYMYSSDGTKRYKVTINSATNEFVLTEG